MKRKLRIAGALVALVLIAWLVWAKVAGTTQIALVNFPNYQVARMAKSLDNSFIGLHPLTLDDFDRLGRYDAVVIFGMGIRMTDEHRAVLEKLKARGVPLFSTAVTDPVNNITSLDSVQHKRVADYLAGGGSANYRSLFNIMVDIILVVREVWITTMPATTTSYRPITASTWASRFIARRKADGWVSGQSVYIMYTRV